MTDALSAEAFLAGNAELLECRADCQNDGPRAHFCVATLEQPAAILPIETFQTAGSELCPRGDRLLLDHRAQVVTRNPFDEPGKSLNLFDADKKSAENVP